MSGQTKEIIDTLKAREPLELKRPQRVYDEKLTDKIADLKLHPAIEVGLHLLNDDLYSAHFVRVLLSLPSLPEMKLAVSSRRTED